MVAGSLKGASRTVEVLPLTSTHATSSAAPLNVTSPLTLPDSWVGVGMLPPSVGSVTSHPSSAVGRYVAVGVADGGEAVGDAAPEGDAEDAGEGEDAGAEEVAEGEGDAVAPGPAWPATSVAGGE